MKEFLTKESIKKMRIKWFSIIRVIGLLLVLLYHFVPGKFSGGFLGVDLFFTFSGYLITALFIDEYIKRNNVSLTRFYQRRFQRIFPPLLLMIMICVPLSLIASPDFRVHLEQQVTAALSFMTNIYEINAGNGYEAQFTPHLFVHTWSLALEMQFYLLWGLIAALSAQIIKRLNLSVKKQSSLLRATLFFISLTFTILSFSSLIISNIKNTDPSIRYFSSTSHTFPFFLGSTVACITGIQFIPKYFRDKMNNPKYVRRYLIFFMTSFIMLLILSLNLTFTHPLTYWIGFLLASILTVVMIVSARVLHEYSDHIKEPQWIIFLADTSYSIYLFHWPLFLIFSRIMSTPLAVILTLILSVLFASISYYFLEPLLMGKKTLKFGLTGPILLTIGILLITTTITLLLQTPEMTQLEKSLWESSLYQDQDRLAQTRKSVEDQEASKYNFPEGVSIIGDSVTLGVRQDLQEAIPDSIVDAQISRNMIQATDIVLEQQEQNLLREYVVVAIGTNPIGNYEEETMRLVDGLDKGHKLILVTPNNPQASNGALSDEQRLLDLELAQQYPFITVADWYEVARAHPEIFAGTDGIHFEGNIEGSELYVGCIQQALEEAAKKPGKN